ncbi:hypothetical protein CRV24_007816 [Beauveria bassiana]|nr:hypothetical protein CRV24_007816 [Beauveria bassiana]
MASPQAMTLEGVVTQSNAKLSALLGKAGREDGISHGGGLGKGHLAGHLDEDRPATGCELAKGTYTGPAPVRAVSATKDAVSGLQLPPGGLIRPDSNDCAGKVEAKHAAGLEKAVQHLGVDWVESDSLDLDQDCVRLQLGKL